MTNKRIQKIDSHVDIADMYRLFKYKQDDFYSDQDLPVTFNKLKTANIKLFGASLYFDKSFVETNFYDGVNECYQWYEKLFSNSSEIKTITNAGEIDEKSNNVNCIYAIEGIQCFRDPEDFEHFFDLGVRIFGLTWEDDNEYACGRSSKNDRGVSRAGLAVLEKMNDKSLIIDVAHLSEQSVKDVAKEFGGMIVSTHSNVRAVYDTTHNLTDEEIQIIVDRGGVISLFPFSADTGEKGTFDEFYKHIEYVMNKWGEDYVAISSDIYPLEEYPFLEGHEDILILNELEDFLLQKLDRKIVKKIFFDNWMRVLRRAV